MDEISSKVLATPLDGLTVDIATQNLRFWEACHKVASDAPASAAPVQNPPGCRNSQPSHLVHEVSEHFEALNPKRQAVQARDPFLQWVRGLWQLCIRLRRNEATEPCRGCFPDATNQVQTRRSGPLKRQLDHERQGFGIPRPLKNLLDIRPTDRLDGANGFAIEIGLDGSESVVGLKHPAERQQAVVRDRQQIQGARERR